MLAPAVGLVAQQGFKVARQRQLAVISKSLERPDWEMQIATSVGFKVAVDTHLTVISGEVTPEEDYKEFLDQEEDEAKEISWIHKLELLIASPRLPGLVKWIYDNQLVKDGNERPKLYIPFNTREIGRASCRERV